MTDFERKMQEADNLFLEDENYKSFTEKFKGKKTTDDCYTPGREQRGGCYHKEN